MTLFTKKRLILSAIITCLFSVSLFITLPAKLAYQWGLYPQDISMSGIKGHYTSGTAKWLSSNGINVQNISWQWQPLSLLMGRVAFDITSEDIALEGNVRAAVNLFGRSSLSDGQLNLDLSKFMPLFPKGLVVKGKVNIESLNTSINQDKTGLELAFKADSGLVEVKSRYLEAQIEHLTVEASGHIEDGIIFKLTHAQRPAEMDISLILHQDGSAQLSGFILRNSPNASNLKALLPFVAKKQGERWDLSWQGTVPKF